MKIFIKAILALSLFIMIFNFSYSQDTPEKTKKIITDIYDNINNKNTDAAMKDLDASCVDHIPFVPDQKSGVDGFRQVVDLLFKAFPDFHQAINDIVISSDGKKASVIMTITGTNRGEFMGMKPTNNKVEILGIDNFHIENGKFTDHWGFVDDQKMMMQLQGILK